MPRCPRCHDEYTDDVDLCATCRVALVADGAPLPPRVDRLLGTFHPLLIAQITGLLHRRGVAHQTLPAGQDRVEVLVERNLRDDLRAELAINWDRIVATLDTEERVSVIDSRARQPGWFDAPTAAWVDREGRLQVDASDDADGLADAGRQWGPALVVIGIVVGLFGWYGQASGGLLVLGLVIVGLGLFLPA